MMVCIPADGELVNRFKLGEVAAYDALTARHRPQVVQHAQRLLQDFDDAQTAAQEVFLRVFRGLHGFDEAAEFSTWLYRITQNVCFTALAVRKREQRKRHAYALAHAGDGWIDAGDIRAADSDNFGHYLGDLAADERQLLALRFVADKELRDIAQITGKSLSATKMRMYRALDKLRSQLETAQAA